MFGLEIMTKHRHVVHLYMLMDVYQGTRVPPEFLSWSAQVSCNKNNKKLPWSTPRRPIR